MISPLVARLRQKSLQVFLEVQELLLSYSIHNWVEIFLKIQSITMYFLKWQYSELGWNILTIGLKYFWRLNYIHNWVEIFLKTLPKSQWVFIFWSSNIHNWVEIFLKIKYIQIFLKTLPITIFEELMIQWSSNSWRKFVSFYSFIRIPEFWPIPVEF